MSLVMPPLRCSVVLLACVGLSLLSCSDPASPTAQAGFHASFSGANCNAKNNRPGGTLDIGVGAVNESSKSLLGEADGITVSCTVVPINDGVAADVQIQGASGLSLHLVGDITKSGSTLKSVTLRDPVDSAVYAEASTDPCTAHLISGSGGQVWASFVCNTMQDQQTSSNVCGLNFAYIAAENCGQ